LRAHLLRETISVAIAHSVACRFTREHCLTQRARRIYNQVGRRSARFWTLLFIALGTVFVIYQRTALARFAGALSGADWRWLLVLGALQAGAVGLTALTYRSALTKLGHHLSWRRCVDLHLERHVVGTITPVGGPASMYAFIRRVQTHGIGSGDALLALGVRSVAGYTAFVALLLPALLIHRPSLTVLVGFVVLTVLLLLMLAGFFVLQRRQWLPKPVVQRLPSGVVRFLAQLTNRRLAPSAFFWPFVFALATNLASAFVLLVALFAMGAEASPTTAIAGYAIGNLFLLIAPIFQGIGIVELTMAVALQQLGIPLPTAVGATILFRFGDVWLPLIAGVLIHFGRRIRIRSILPSTQPGRRGLLGSSAAVVASAVLGIVLVYSAILLT
jgi:uncharacterized membrane protein YbhN (UPF0104 family)